jgi:hypothetical protein
LERDDMEKPKTRWFDTGSGPGAMVPVSGDHTVADEPEAHRMTIKVYRIAPGTLARTEVREIVVVPGEKTDQYASMAFPLCGCPRAPGCHSPGC